MRPATTRRVGWAPERGGRGLSETIPTRRSTGGEQPQAIARAALRYGAEIVGSGDGLVAMLARPPAAGSGRRRAAAEDMRVVASMGRFHEMTEPIRRGEGFWGRLWASGSALAEDEAGNGILVGAPMQSGGVVWGVIGFVLGPGVAVSPERLRMLDNVRRWPAQRRMPGGGATRNGLTGLTGRSGEFPYQPMRRLICICALLAPRQTG
jgi:hypothetical protein